MRRTVALVKIAFVLSSLIVISVRAEVSAPLAAQRREAQTLLKKIQTAAQKLSYSGTFVYQQGNEVRTSRITHVLEGRNELEKLEVLDGKPREYLRNNDEIICYVPESRTLLIEKRVTRDVFPAILAANPADLAAHYDIRPGERGRVAGFDSQSVILLPKDDLRYGYKLWAERSTGLLLRAQTLNDKNDVVEQISFTQIAIGNIDKSLVRPSIGNTKGWRVENAVMRPVDLSGWHVNWVPPGFKKIQEVGRLLSDVPADGRSGKPAQREVSQIVYSDGLAAISIFIEPGSQGRQEGSLQQGAMNILGKRQGAFWLTIVGEIPSAAIRQVANSIEYKAPR
ncbi:MAG: transcriptional regulator [Herminiimonas sp.]|nr:transcriptional regulator [Herminiimonas sp.]